MGFFNSSCKMEFTHDTVQPFKEYDSIVWGVFRVVLSIQSILEPVITCSLSCPLQSLDPQPGPHNHESAFCL